MNDLLMSSNLSERISLPGTGTAIVCLDFGKEKINGRFISIEEKDKLLIIIGVDEHDCPFKYFGLSASKAIINTGSETIIYDGEFKITKIEKSNQYLLKIGADKYERNIRNEFNRDS